MLARAARQTVGLASRSSQRPALGAVRMYHENIVDHYENPRNVGSMDAKDITVGTGLVGAPACGDVMKLQIKVDDNGVISEAKFKTFGCGSAIASRLVMYKYSKAARAARHSACSSVATEWIQGMNIEECTNIKNKDIASHLKLPPVKLHCSMLAEDAIKAAVKDYKAKKTASA